MRGKKEYHSAFRVQRSERQREWHFRQPIRAGVFIRGRRRWVLRRGMWLPLGQQSPAQSRAIVFQLFFTGLLIFQN
jgi:hypothetical protein